MSKKSKIGKYGEELARKFLSERGIEIRHCNWIFKHKEIDIIAENKKYLLIIEVKTRSDPEFEDPREAITLTKQKNIVYAAQHYVDEFDIEKEVRFDVISVVMSKNEYEIEYIEDAFTPYW